MKNKEQKLKYITSITIKDIRCLYQEIDLSEDVFTNLLLQLS